MDNISLLSEVQALRETIFMLLGYPCALFRLGENADDEVVWINEDAPRKFAIRSMSQRGFTTLLEWFAERGTILNRIRALGKRDEQLPERQAFVAACEKKLAELGKELTDIEARFVGAGKQTVASIWALETNRVFDRFCGNSFVTLSPMSPGRLSPAFSHPFHHCSKAGGC